MKILKEGVLTGAGTRVPDTLWTIGKKVICRKCDTIYELDTIKDSSWCVPFSDKSRCAIARCPICDYPNCIQEKRGFFWKWLIS